MKSFVNGDYLISTELLENMFLISVSKAEKKKVYSIANNGQGVERVSSFMESLTIQQLNDAFKTVK